ncbi:MAG: LysE family translocator [Chitinophagaceae bacterium]
MIENFWVFVLAALLLNLTPGNDMLYVAARSTGQGVKAGVISALGIMGGGAVHIFLAMIGLSAVIAKSALAFEIIKYLGAGYLIFLGIKAVVAKKTKLEVNHSIKPLSLNKIFWQGVVTNVLNPKVALFFLAFLPQFINLNSNTSWQILFLGGWFNIQGTLINIIVALLFGKIGNWLSNSPRFILLQQKITGIVLVGLGIKVALSSKQ